MQRLVINSAHGSDTRNAINVNFQYLFQGVERMNQLNVKADNTLREAERINSINNDTNDRLDNLIPNSETSSTETVDARVGEDGSVYPVLKRRLDKEKNQTDSRLSDISINVKDFGAVADANYFDEDNKLYYSDAAMTIPATDNQEAFQAAVDFVYNSGGGTVYAPFGNYVFRDGVKVKNRVSIKGHGINATKFFTEGDVFDLFYNLDSPNFGYEDIEDFLEDMQFEGFQCDLIGLKSTGSNVHGKALFILSMRRGRFRDLLLKNTIGTALGCDFLTETVIDSVVVYNAGRNWGNVRPDGSVNAVGQSGIGIGTGALEAETVVVTNCHTFNSGNYGVFVETQSASINQSTGAKIIACHSEGNRIGFGNKGSGATKFIGCTAFNNIENGIHLTQRSHGDSISSCEIKGNGVGVLIDRRYAGDLSIIDSDIHHNNSHGIAAGYDNTEITKGIDIENTRIYHNGNVGVIFDRRVDNLKISGGKIFNNGQNLGGSYSEVGVYLQDTQDLSVTNVTFNDDQSSKTQKTSIYIGSGVKDYFLSGNEFNEPANIRSEDGIILDNDLTVKRGVATIPGTELRTYINHNFTSNTRRPAKLVLLTPQGNERVWFRSDDGNRILIEKENATTEPLDVFYEIRL